MNRFTSVLSILLIFISYVNSQDITHLTFNSGVLNTSSSTVKMTERIKEAATEYKMYGPVPRFVQYDFAFASDVNEYKKLNGFGILYITSLNSDSTEYPITRVYFKSEGGYAIGLIDLKLIGSMKISVTDSLINKIFGQHRIDYYYYLPYEMTQLTGSILIDWTNNRKEFVLTKFPNDFTLDFLKNTKLILPDPKKAIDDKSFDEFADREFQIKFNR